MLSYDITSERLFKSEAFSKGMQIDGSRSDGIIDGESYRPPLLCGTGAKPYAGERPHIMTRPRGRASQIRYRSC